jgi:5-formyltetrahydrofolate cyclo-ligase
MDGKASLRAELLAARSRRTEHERAAAGDALAQLALQEWPEVSAVAAYAGVGSEPPTRPLLDALRAQDREVWLPVVAGSELRWAPYDGWERLVEGPVSLLEPPPGASVGELPDAVTLWLVPALAVDRHGVRLGRGGGYYDRALARAGAPRPPREVVAVVYDTEVVERLPREQHDVPVDAALLPNGVVRLG